MLGHGGTSVDGELGFAPLAIQRWPSEGAFRAWLASEAYQPLRQIRIASATVRVAVADEKNVGGASVVNHGEVDQETFLHPQLEGVQQLFPAA
jgi:hypothetical protein